MNRWIVDGDFKGNIFSYPTPNRLNREYGFEQFRTRVLVAVVVVAVSAATVAILETYMHI